MKRRLLLVLTPLLIFDLPPAAWAQVDSTPELRLSNFPAYATTLAPEHLGPIRAAAQELVTLARSGKPVFVMTTGNADFDSKGRAFEDQVSRRRGESGLRALRTEFELAADEGKLSAAERARVDFWDVLAMGTRDAIVKRPTTEAERRLNRRIDVYWWTDEALGIATRRKIFAK